MEQWQLLFGEQPTGRAAGGAHDADPTSNRHGERFPGGVGLIAGSRDSDIQVGSLSTTVKQLFNKFQLFHRIISDDFQLDQVLELQDSHQTREVRFMHLPESEDLLLCVSNVVPHQPLTIYQHSGAAGFQKILGDSALPEVQSLDVLQLPVNKLQLVSVATAESVYFVQPQFTTL